MKKNTFLLLSSFLIAKLAVCQCCVDAPATSAEKIQYLNRLKGQVDNQNFRKIVFNDFSKFVIGEDNQFGRAINYASIEINKPKATLNLYAKTHEKGFFNFMVSGGYESDLFSLISDKKPAGSFTSTLSYSLILFRPLTAYWYYPSNKHQTWSTLIKNFDDSVNIKCLDKNISCLNDDLERLNNYINDNFYTKKNKLDSNNSTAIIDSLARIDSIKHIVDSLEKVKAIRVAFVDTLANRAKWSTRWWSWITGAVNYGGISYKYYNRNDVNQQLLSDVKTFTRTGTLSANFLYKTMMGGVWRRLLNNSLITVGLSYGRQNNFVEFTASEYKNEQKVDSTATNTTHTKTQSRQVYTDVLKEYDAFTYFIEVVKLFGKDGIIGLRNRFEIAKPEQNFELKRQTNWEAGLLFNTTSKKEKDVTKFSLELFVKFRDLNGNNVQEEDKPQKFHERQTIGIRTNLPFRMLSL